MSSEDIIHVSEDTPGYMRKRWGRGFVYLDESKKKVDDSEVLDRIRQLVIPPAWEDVWICVYDCGHIQATGLDERGRKQYIYHPVWSQMRQKNKFSRLLHFGEKLPEVRRRIDADLRKHGWPKARALALAVTLLDEYYFRIGNHQYARQNDSYGLTTLRRKHIAEEGNRLHISYIGKSRKLRNISVRNRRLVRLIREISELPGYEIFRYQYEGKKTKKLNSADVNEYLRELFEDQVTAKTFRTWGGTCLAIGYYEDAWQAVDENPRKKFEPTLVKNVARSLGNTVAICRKYYIHPFVKAELEKRNLDQYMQKARKRYENEEELDEKEKLVLTILRSKACEQS
jgi:DNA topoisomerase-1